MAQHFLKVMQQSTSIELLSNNRCSNDCARARRAESSENLSVANELRWDVSRATYRVVLIISNVSWRLNGFQESSDA